MIKRVKIISFYALFSLLKYTQYRIENFDITIFYIQQSFSAKIKISIDAISLKSN